MKEYNKVFGIGLGKTGTGSTHQALRVLGFYSAHKRNEKGEKESIKNGEETIPPMILPEDFNDGYDAGFDTSVAGRFEVLDKMYPNSLFIYTVRELESWLRSIYLENYHIGFKRGNKSEPYHLPEMTWDAEMYYANMHTYGPVQSKYFQRHWWAARYLEHAHRVYRYFEHRKNVLLVLNVCAGQGWELLCPFLGKEIPDWPFPHEKRRKYEKQWEEPPQGLLY